MGIVLNQLLYEMSLLMIRRLAVVHINSRDFQGYTSISKQ
jgi:hypothetical protein